MRPVIFYKIDLRGQYVFKRLSVKTIREKIAAEQKSIQDYRDHIVERFAETKSICEKAQLRANLELEEADSLSALVKLNAQLAEAQRRESC